MSDNRIYRDEDLPDEPWLENIHIIAGCWYDPYTEEFGGPKDGQMVAVIRTPKKGTGYPRDAVTRAAELQAEDADPELHHHEVSHSHPFENLDHTHDQPKLDEQEKDRQ